MAFCVYRSVNDPTYFIITTPDRSHQVRGEYKSSAPNDDLIELPGDQAARILDTVPSLGVAENVIDFVGYFGYALEGTAPPN